VTAGGRRPGPAGPPAAADEITEPPLVSLPPRLVELVRSFDGAVEERWERLRGVPALDRLFYTASAAGEFSLIWHVAGAARAVATRRPGDALRFSTVMLVESAIVNGGIKTVFRRARPAAPVVPRPHALRQPLTTSFPSGHASSAFCAATVLSAGGSPLSPVWWVLASLVAASRVHVGIHHPSDVVAGATVGVAIGTVARRVLRRLG
jgi:undecaprenyl-diphosphatase